MLKIDIGEYFLIKHSRLNEPIFRYMIYLIKFVLFLIISVKILGYSLN